MVAYLSYPEAMGEVIVWTLTTADNVGVPYARVHRNESSVEVPARFQLVEGGAFQNVAFGGGVVELRGSNMPWQPRVTQPGNKHPGQLMDVATDGWLLNSIPETDDLTFTAASRPRIILPHVVQLAPILLGSTGATVQVRVVLTSAHLRG